MSNLYKMEDYGKKKTGIKFKNEVARWLITFIIIEHIVLGFWIYGQHR